MKILVVNWQDRLNPQAGGAEVHLHEIFGRLARRGHDVTLLCAGFSKASARDQLDGIEIHRVGGRLSFTHRAAPYFRRRLASEGFDVVVEDLNKVPLFTPLWSRIPVVLLVHHLFGRTAFQEASLPIALATWLLERPIPRIFRRCPVVAVSESTILDLRRRGLTRQEMKVVPNGVDLDRYTPLEHGSMFREPTLLYLGRLKRYKRVDLIIEAVARLLGEGFVCKLLVAGKGDDADRLQELRDRRGLQDDVEFLGFVEDAEKVELLRRSWVHVLTSPKEGWGIANMEAAACGIPTVASDSPGLRDSVKDGETGILVPHGDITALAKALRNLLEDDRRREAMGAAARAFAEGFSWDKSARAMEEFLQVQVTGYSDRR